jgi:uncharacterized UBP type Zn finger protein
MEQVPVQVQEDLLKELLEMGFTEARAARGLHFSGNSSVEGAINWLSEHETDADLDTPLLVPQVSYTGMSSNISARQRECLEPSVIRLDAGQQ